MNTKQIENEKNCPELIELREIALNEKEPEDKRCQTAFCYALIVLALQRVASPERGAE